MSRHPASAERAHDAALVACLLAVDPPALGGASIRSAYGPAIEHFQKLLQRLLPAGAAFRRVPPQIADSRLLGGLDLAATLQAGKPVFERGLLADADGGCIVLPMAERLPLAMAARLCAVLDASEVVVEREGFACRNRSRLAILALDEGMSDDERPPLALLDRLAFQLNLDSAHDGDDLAAPFDAPQINAARAILPEIMAADAMLKAFCQAAVTIGIASVRAPAFAAKVACVHAALSGRRRLSDDDAIVASRLVLAPRATVLPAPMSENESAARPSEQSEPSDPHDHPAPGQDSASEQSTAADSGKIDDIVLEAARAAIPAYLLDQLRAPAAGCKPSNSLGRTGAQRQSLLRGKPAGTRPGELKAGARLNVVETLRAAAPWQRLRSQQPGAGRVQVRRDDFRITRFNHRRESATIFVVDASGSSALHRLAEAKGAVELLLADCYVRRDQVALIGFRGKGAEIILPPTRSLARAKRSLATLPGGGGTPVAAALDAAGALADGLSRKGLAPMIVLLTDGRANVARDGGADRDRALTDALCAARSCRALRLTTLLIDTSPTPGPAAERLAVEMGARYLPLPRADAATISQAVRDPAPRELAASAR